MADFDVISAEKLKEKIDSGEDFVLVDVLAQGSYESRHLPGAINIPYHGEDFSEQVKEKLQDKSKEIIVYCASESCQASPSAAKALVGMGYENVSDFEDGVAGWEEAGYEFE